MNSEMSGVGFSRHPLKPLSSDVSLIEAVYGLGEGLVSGLLEADHYEVRLYDICQAQSVHLDNPWIMSLLYYLLFRIRRQVHHSVIRDFFIRFLIPATR